MRLARLQWLLLLAGCAAGPAAAGAGRPLGEDLFPLEARTARFATSGEETRTLRLAPEDGRAVLWIEGGAEPLRIDVRREGAGYHFSAGPSSEAELLRIGAPPGTTWTSGDATVRFEGWERLVLPAGTFDAARIRCTSGPPSLPTTETWWFAPARGLVRWRIDKGGLLSEELTLRP
jgi:hypothetical protein